MAYRTLLHTAQASAPARALLRRRYAHRFRTPRGAGALCGVYASFAEAEAAAPRGAARGYETAESGRMYADRLDRITPRDYPVLYWLSRVLPGTTSLFDLGGHVGISYYAFRHYLDYPAGLRWTVCDTAAVVGEGEALAGTRGESRLAFTTRAHEGEGADVLLAAGSLQYVPQPLDRLLAGWARRPRYLVINQTPTHPHREFYTLQNIGVGFCAYRIASRAALLASIGALGYELVDSWDDPSRRTGVPYHADAWPIAYSGFVFRLS